MAITRREFLVGSATAGLVAVTETSLGSLLTPRLTGEERATLLAIARTMFPHPEVDDGVYRLSVDAIETRCSVDEATLDAITHGIASLDKASGGSFVRARDQVRVDLLSSLRSTDFFRIVYRETLERLYGSPEMWSIFRSVPSTRRL